MMILEFGSIFRLDKKKLELGIISELALAQNFVKAISPVFPLSFPQASFTILHKRH
jgi:hypothetical protein